MIVLFCERKRKSQEWINNNDNKNVVNKRFVRSSRHFFFFVMSLNFEKLSFEMKSGKEQEEEKKMRD